MDFVFVYSYLQQNHEMPDLVLNSAIDNELEYYKNSDDQGDSLQYLMMQRFWRLIDADYKIDPEIFYGSEGLDSVTVQALYCDQFQIDTASYFSHLRKSSEALNYNTTHALLSLVFLKNNHCYTDESLESLSKEIENKNLELIANNDYEWNDLNIETLAFLSESGAKYKKSWIKNILKLQQEDGGWKGKERNETSNSHTTVLALWLILNVMDDVQK